MRVSDRIRQRILVEELVRKRRSDDAERFVEVFRRSTVDPNPHQIEAAMFALRRLPAGGAMLCDEVGLGKTIEAGLVITQLRAEGKAHILVIVPLALARQWQVEMQDLFSVKSTIVGADNIDQESGRGIHIVGREFASSTKGRAWLERKAPWDLVVIDEAHEMFATIYNRFKKTNGKYEENLNKGAARRAAQVRAAIAGSPVLLLTATPLQNNLYELWGLVQYVDPEQQVLGKFNEFNSLFVTGEGGRSIEPGMEGTLRQRLSLVVKRTLRRQAQPFMKQPFRARHVHTANFNPERLETELYAAVSAWLSQESMAAYKRGHRSLMALQLRRRMASSTEALVSTLVSVKERMLKIQQTGVYPGKANEDLELEDLGDDAEDNRAVDMDLLRQDLAEVERLESLARQALRAGADVKKRRLLEIISQVKERSLSGVASDKIVIFTESLKTLDSLVVYLEENGLANEITTFAGQNDGPIARRALAQWKEDIGRFQSGAALDESAALRGALIHEFKTRTRVLIATEAGAKGLNLQFCNCLVNYDLPWNPQRIEQRIGRVHRYGQKYDVVIVNFINLSNEAEQRVYDLLQQKLTVFKEAVDASDTILNTPELALNLEVRINEMLDRCRTQEEIQEAFDRLNLEFDRVNRELRDERLASSRQLLSELDTSVQARLGRLDGEIVPALSRCDEALLEIISAEGTVEVIGPSGPRTLLKWNGKLCHLGPPEPSEEFGEPIYREHPDVQSVITRCIEATDGTVLEDSAEDNSVSEVYRVRLNGFEGEDRILVVGTVPIAGIVPLAVDLESGLQQLKVSSEKHQRDYVERLIAQIASRREDLRLCGNSAIAELQKKVDMAERKRKTAVTHAEIQKAQTNHKKLVTLLETTRRETAAETDKNLKELDEKESRIRLMQFVDATPQLLFTVKHVAATQRSLA